MTGILFLHSETGTEGGYWAFQDSLYIKHEEKIRDSWSYEGLHILKDGDYLTIYHPNNNIEVWSGVINFKQYELFSEHASGMRIHADQIGIERDVWAKYFLKNYSAKLIPSNKYK